MKRLVTVLAGVLALASPLAAQDAAKKPPAKPPTATAGHPWAAWKPGAWVKLEVQGGGGKATITDTLVKVEGDSVLIKRKTEMGGQTFENDERRPLVLGGFAHLADRREKEGEEWLEIEEKQVQCTIWKAVWERPADKRGVVQQSAARFEVRSWIAEGTLLPLKTSWEGPGNVLITEVTKMKDPFAVAGKTISCLRVESRSAAGGIKRGNFESKGSETSTVQLQTLDVPGGIVKSTSETRFGDQTSKNEMVAVGFGGEKVGTGGAEPAKEPASQPATEPAKEPAKEPTSRPGGE